MDSGVQYFSKKDQKIQESVIEDINGLEYIISEVLGDREITSKKDVEKLKNMMEFHPKFKDRYESNKYKGYNSSSSYLVEFYEKFNIPIIGIGSFYSSLNKNATDLYQIKHKTLSLVGRKHVDEIFDMVDNGSIYLPNYDLE